MPKELTREQVAGRKDKAVRFLRGVLDDPGRADEVDDESIEDYAARRHFVLTNPQGKGRRRRQNSPEIHGSPVGKEVTAMPQREKLADVVADRDELLDKVEELRDLADDVLSEYEPEEEEEEEEEEESDNAED
jgi:hypothetical protein